MNDPPMIVAEDTTWAEVGNGGSIVLAGEKMSLEEWRREELKRIEKARTDDSIRLYEEIRADLDIFDPPSDRSR
jgi:hypothetical protein